MSSEMTLREITERIIELKRQYIFLLNEDKPRQYEAKIKTTEEKIEKLEEGLIYG